MGQRQLYLCRLTCAPCPARAAPGPAPGGWRTPLGRQPGATSGPPSVHRGARAAGRWRSHQSHQPASRTKTPGRIRRWQGAGSDAPCSLVFEQYGAAADGGQLAAGGPGRVLSRPVPGSPTPLWAGLFLGRMARHRRRLRPQSWPLQQHGGRRFLPVGPTNPSARRPGRYRLLGRSPPHYRPINARLPPVHRPSYCPGPPQPLFHRPTVPQPPNKHTRSNRAPESSAPAVLLLGDVNLW